MQYLPFNKECMRGVGSRDGGRSKNLWGHNSKRWSIPVPVFFLLDPNLGGGHCGGGVHATKAPPPFSSAGSAGEGAWPECRCTFFRSL